MKVLRFLLLPFIRNWPLISGESRQRGSLSAGVNQLITLARGLSGLTESSRSDGAYTISVAGTHRQVRAAQRLRGRVFGSEFSAAVPAELDADEFDSDCDHLIVVHRPSREVVGTYRLRPPGRRGELYSEHEFDLRALKPVRGELVEAGRSCVHPAHRSGAVINLMWAGLLRYSLLGGYRYLGGCASVPLSDDGQAAADTWALAQERHLSPNKLRVRPWRPWLPPTGIAGRERTTSLPPLLRGYLRLGAWICGPPAHDPEFGVADFFVLLPLERMNERYLRFFLGHER